MSDKVYVVLQDVGEWSDHQTTVMCACANEEVAQQKVLKFTEQAKIEALAQKDMDIFFDEYYNSNPHPCDTEDQNLPETEFTKRVQVWDDLYEMAREDKLNQLMASIDINEFDERKDRYYDYPHYTYREVELHNE